MKKFLILAVVFYAGREWGALSVWRQIEDEPHDWRYRR